MEITDERFDELVDEAFEEIPEELLALLDNVVVLVEDEPQPPEASDLLGLYVGTPLTERGGDYVFQPPDQIFLYRGPLTRMCADEEELADEIAITLVHEIAHHFGIDDESLHAWGWG